MLQPDGLGVEPLRQERAGPLVAPILYSCKTKHPAILKDQVAARANLGKADGLALRAAAKGASRRQ
jgi:hypothetical protein